MIAADFVRIFTRKVKELCPVGHSYTEWTRQIREILYEIGCEADMSDIHCIEFEYKGEMVGKGEIFQIDFMFFEKCPNPSCYDMPAVMIEHENECDLKSKYDDFNKLCYYACPLRVFIGYSDHKSEADRQAVQLMVFYKKLKFRQISDGETLIMLSWDEANNYEWIAWALEPIRITPFAHR